MWGSSNAGALGNVEYPFIAIAPGPQWSGMVAPDRILPIGQIELSCLLMLNWIAWNRTVLTFKLCTYAKLNCLKWDWFCRLT